MSAAVAVQAASRAMPSPERSLGYHVRQLFESWNGALHRKVDAHGVTEGQWRYLRELWEQDGLTQRELSERVGRQTPTTVAALRSLQRCKFIDVEQNGVDRRKNEVCLTTLGRRSLEKLAPLLEETEAIALAGLSPREIRTFARLMIRIQLNLDAANGLRNAWARKRTDEFAKRMR